MQDSSLKKASSIYESSRNKIIQVWSMQKNIKNNFQQGKINEKCIILVGDTNVGKTTLLYYLSGMKLKLIENIAKKTKEMQPQQIYENAIICNNLSTTQIPNVFSKDEGVSAVSLIDMPGMNDNRFMSLISNIFTFDQVFHKIDVIKQIHIAFVISQEMFDAQDIKENIREFTEHFNIEHFETSKNISLIFTKTQDDLDSLKETFFEFLESIKQDIQEEQERDISKFIEILERLNTQEQLAYCFPKQQPDQEQGQSITRKIVQRNQFIENDQISLLNGRLEENILHSSKLKFSTFESNFNELLNQLQKTIESSLQMAGQLVKFMHKNFVSSLFGYHDSFQSSRNDFSSKYFDLILSFRIKDQPDDSFKQDQLSETITTICSKVTREKSLYQIDKALRQTLNLVNSEEISTEQDQQKFHFLIHFTKSLSKVFNKIEKVLRSLEITEVLIESLQNIANFSQWISSSFFTGLSKIDSLPKITDKLTETTSDLIKLKEELWDKLSKNQPYFEMFNNFSQKEIEEDQSGSQYQSQPEPQKVYVTAGPTISELKQKYIKPKYYEKVTSTINSLKPISRAQKSQQKQLQRTIGKIVKQLEQKILPFQKWSKYYPSESLPFTDEEISMFFFQKKHLRHIIYLESALKNFFEYLKFFFYMINVEMERKRNQRQVIKFLECFIETICEVLQQYSLYQEAILIYLFINNFEKALKTMTDGFEKGRIGQKFITQDLINKILELVQLETKMTTKRHEEISQVIVKCYNYLISECSESRHQQKEYQIQLESTLNKISNPQQAQMRQYTHQIKMNYTILDTRTFSINKILKKIDIIEKRNQQSKIYPVYKEMFPPRPKPQTQMTKTPQINEKDQNFARISPQ